MENDDEAFNGFDIFKKVEEVFKPFEVKEQLRNYSKLVYQDWFNEVGNFVIEDRKWVQQLQLQQKKEFQDSKLEVAKQSEEVKSFSLIASWRLEKNQATWSIENKWRR